MKHSIPNLLSIHRLHLWRVVLVSTALLILTGVVVGGHSWFRPSDTSSKSVAVKFGAVPISAGPTQAASSAQRLEAELVTLRPTGFEPAQFTRGQGQFLVAVNNQTGLEDRRYDSSAVTARASAKCAWRAIGCVGASG